MAELVLVRREFSPVPPVVSIVDTGSSIQPSKSVNEIRSLQLVRD